MDLCDIVARAEVGSVEEREGARGACTGFEGTSLRVMMKAQGEARGRPGVSRDPGRAWSLVAFQYGFL